MITVRYRRHLERLIDGLKATSFQKKVWKALLGIPEGEVRTYGWVARRVGCPRAARAVGSALKKNRLAPMVPCHRVVRSDGLGGYSGGVGKKRALLEKEGVVF